MSTSTTTLAIDQPTLLEAMRLGHFKTKKETVNIALSELVRHRKVEEAIAAMGTIDFDETYDYKVERRREQQKLDQFYKTLDI